MFITEQLIFECDATSCSSSCALFFSFLSYKNVRHEHTVVLFGHFVEEKPWSQRQAEAKKGSTQTF